MEEVREVSDHLMEMENALQDSFEGCRLSADELEGEIVSAGEDETVPGLTSVEVKLVETEVSNACQEVLSCNKAGLCYPTH